LATKYKATIAQSSDEKVTAVPVMQCGLVVVGSWSRALRRR
jgi:hypothetical protein